MNFKLKAGAFAPIRAHKQDAGVDLLSPVTVTIYPGDSATIDTGVCAEIPEGFCGQIWSKSGLNVNHGILSTGMSEIANVIKAIDEVQCAEAQRNR